MASDLPSHAQAVIIGGGVIGCSVAYHLAKLGWRDVVLLERRRLTCGTTWHAAGLIGQLRATPNLTRLAKYSADLYLGLEGETGQPTGFKQNGSIGLARTTERLTELRRQAAMGRACGLEVHELTPGEARELYPLIEVGDLAGAIHIPADGQANPIDIAQALAKGARRNGARIVEGCRVTGIAKANGRVTGVETELGPVRADVVVNCAGMWGRAVGRMAGVSVPLHACEHFYVLTEPMPEVPPDLPVLRDPDGGIYVKEDAGKLLVGAFEPVAKPWGMDGIPDDFEFGELPEDWDHFMPILEDAMRRIPALERTGIRKFFCGPESFTPDDRYLLGEAPELAGFFVACGFNSIGIQSAGGAGKVLAEWIVGGHAPMDLADVDIRRMQPFQSNARYLRDRVTEGLGLLYAMHWPFRQYATARPARTSPLHDRLKAQGACFAEAAGWERPGWFAPPGAAPEYDYAYGRTAWFERWASEHRAVRERVGLFDLSSFGKFLVQGRDAEAVLQRVCANDVAVAPGRIVYTPWLNERGGIEADLTVTRLAEDAYLVVTSAASQNRDLHWLKRHIPEEAHACVTDVTSGYAVLALMGPESRALLAELTSTDLCQRCVPVRHRAGDRARLRGRARAPHFLRRRARLRIVHPDRVRPAGVRRDRRGGGRSAGVRRLPCARFAAPGESVSPLGPRHRRRGHAAGGRPRLRVRVRQGGAVHRPRRAAGAEGAHAHQAPGAVQAAGSRAPAVPRRADRHGRRADRPAHLRLLWPHARRRDRHGLGAPPGRGHARTPALGPVRDRDRRRAPSGRSQPARLL